MKATKIRLLIAVLFLCVQVINTQQTHQLDIKFTPSWTDCENYKTNRFWKELKSFGYSQQMCFSGDKIKECVSLQTFGCLQNGNFGGEIRCPEVSYDPENSEISISTQDYRPEFLPIDVSWIYEISVIPSENPISQINEGIVRTVEIFEIAEGKFQELIDSESTIVDLGLSINLEEPIRWLQTSSSTNTTNSDFEYSKKTAMIIFIVFGCVACCWVCIFGIGGIAIFAAAGGGGFNNGSAVVSQQAAQVMAPIPSEVVEIVPVPVEDPSVVNKGPVNVDPAMPVTEIPQKQMYMNPEVLPTPAPASAVMPGPAMVAIPVQDQINGPVISGTPVAPVDIKGI